MKKLGLILFMVIFVPVVGFAQESVTITTYYPSPSGAYQRLTSNYLKFTPQSGASAPEAVTLYWDNGDGQAQGAGFYYWDGDNWNFLGGAGGGGVWTESDGDIYREDGNVGIGTTDPQAQLEIGGTGGLRIKPDPTIAPHILLVSENNLNRQSSIDFSMKSGASEFLLWILGSDLPLENTANFSIHDQQAGQTRLYINPAGNVGIGTTTPASRLDVAGTVTATDFGCAGCLGVPEISQTAFQRRLTGDCPLNNYMFGIEEDGDVKCRQDQTGAGGGGITSINGTTQSVITLAGVGISITDNNFDTITIAATGVGSGDKISEGDSEVEVIDGGTGNIEFIADNEKVMEITEEGGVQIYRTTDTVGNKSFTIGSGTTEAYAYINGTNAGLEISANSASEPNVEFSEGGTSKYHIGYRAGSDYLRIMHHGSSNDVMQIYDSDQRVVFPSGSVRIWDGSASVDYATGQGELYVEKDLEVDGNVCLGGNCKSSWPSLNFYHKYADSDGGSVAIGGTYELRVSCDNDKDLLFSYHCESDELQTVFSELAYHDSRSGFADGVYCKWKKNSVWGTINHVWIVCLKDGRDLFGNWGEF